MDALLHHGQWIGSKIRDIWPDHFYNWINLITFFIPYFNIKKLDKHNRCKWESIFILWTKKERLADLLLNHYPFLILQSLIIFLQLSILINKLLQLLVHYCIIARFQNWKVIYSFFETADLILKLASCFCFFGNLSLKLLVFIC